MFVMSLGSASPAYLRCKQALGLVTTLWSPQALGLGVKAKSVFWVPTCVKAVCSQVEEAGTGTVTLSHRANSRTSYMGVSAQSAAGLCQR